MSFANTACFAVNRIRCHSITLGYWEISCCFWSTVSYALMPDINWYIHWGRLGYKGSLFLYLIVLEHPLSMVLFQHVYCLVLMHKAIILHVPKDILGYKLVQ